LRERLDHEEEDAELAVEGFRECPPMRSGTRDTEDEVADEIDSVVDRNAEDATEPSARRLRLSSRRSSRLKSARATRR
jgi:hypothetical protein